MPTPGNLPQPGDLVWIRRQLFRVRSTFAEADRRAPTLTRLSVTSLGRPTRDCTFLLPAERWTTNRSPRIRRVSTRRALALLASHVAGTSPAFTPSTIVTGTSDILPYQLEPALALLAGVRRILIADAVGLGKTIQAALAISELVARAPETRALLLVPAPLLQQWSEELDQRFALRAHVADADSLARLRFTQPYLTNPWDGPGIWLTSPDFVKQPHVLGGLPPTPWDVVVIDEAHTMAGDSQRRAAVQTLAIPSRHVLLLTATPHDGDALRFRRLMTLGARPGGRDRLCIFRRTTTVNTRHTRRVRLRTDAAVSRVLSAIDGFARMTSRLTRRTVAYGDGERAVHLLCAVFRKRVLSSMPALAASVERRLAVVEQQPTSRPGSGPSLWEQLPLFDSDDVPADERETLLGNTGLTREQESAWLRRLQHLAGRPRSRHDKLARLSTLLRRAGEPAVVFTEYRDSLRAAERELGRGRRPHRVAVIHGGQSAQTQRASIHAFLEGAAQVLLATDVACQGLNLQHRSRWVIHLDLPWTPLRLEQRAGRVDRIGQRRDVHVTALELEHPAQAALRTRLRGRQDASADASLVSRRRWTRVADGLARLFERQRALAARWRGPFPAWLPAATVAPSLLTRLCQAPVLRHADTRIVEVPLVTTGGTVVERMLTVAPGTGHGSTDALERRARTLSARAQVRWKRGQSNRGTGPVKPRQPGLFEPHALVRARGLESGSLESDNSIEERAPRVRVGQPRTLLHLQTGRRRNEQ